MIKIDKVIAVVFCSIIIPAILLGVLMGYRIYKLPMLVYSIDDTINLLKMKKDENDDPIYKLAMYNELERSCKMRERGSNKIRKFSKEEMKEFYDAIGGKELVLEYLKNIKDENLKKLKANEAYYTLRVITSHEYYEILKNI